MNYSIQATHTVTDVNGWKKTTQLPTVCIQAISQENAEGYAKDLFQFNTGKVSLAVFPSMEWAHNDSEGYREDCLS